MSIPAELDEALGHLAPIELAELNERAGLMTRVDRKYFVPLPAYLRLLEESRAELKVLRIMADRRFRYRTVYFDTPDFTLYRQHAQGRRHRFKVRTRTYCDSGEVMLEVKSKGYRGQTVKERIAHDQPRALDRRGSAFVSRLVGFDAGTLEPALETVYDRITLVDGDQRVTCDVGLACSDGERTFKGPPDVLVETKSTRGWGRWDRMLQGAGVRAHSVSKYCAAASLLYPDLPSNQWHALLRRYFEPGFKSPVHALGPAS